MTQDPPQPGQAKRAPGTAACILIAIAVLRIATTYRVFSATADEAVHVGAGLELLQSHRYVLHRENPPLPRLVLALTPYLAGMRIADGNFFERLHSVFYPGPRRYESNLAIGRVGNLLFFLIAAFALFAWARREAGDSVALLALFLFTFEPVVLGHAGLATTDMPATAGMAVSLFAFSRWLRQPALIGALAFAGALTFAVACKFSNLAYVPLACGAVLAVRCIQERVPIREIAKLVAAAVVVLPIGIWALYGFTVGRVSDLKGFPFAFIDAHGSLPLPAPAFFWGVLRVMQIDRGGYSSYLFGHVRTTGWAIYFPVTIALKTTIPFLALVTAAWIVAWRTADLRGTVIECTAAVALILIFVSRSRMDIGIRYVLPVFVLLALIAAAGAIAIARSFRFGPAVVAVVLAVQLILSAAAHPDYFPYFNAFAGPDPSRCLVDSNLDWGQDVLRLRHALRQLRVTHVGISTMGGADYDALGFPPNEPLNSMQPAHGWFAVSDHVYRMDYGSFRGWWWLRRYGYRRIGKSIRLYHIP